MALKKKMIFKIVDIKDPDKRSKAMSLAATIKGVLVMEFGGAEMDELTIIGTGIDVIEVAEVLRKGPKNKCKMSRKGVGWASVVRVEDVKENDKKEDKGKEEKGKEDKGNHPNIPPPWFYYGGYPIYEVTEVTNCKEPCFWW